MDTLSACVFSGEDIWARLQRTDKPVVLYGMGDGADKVLRILSRSGVKPAGVMASDDFVRGQSFHGFTVETLNQARARLGDFVVLQCFATRRPDVLAHIRALAKTCEYYAPDVPVYGDELFDAAFYFRNRQALGRVYDRLADARSKRVFEAVLRYKLSGDITALDGTDTCADASLALTRPESGSVFVDAGAYDGDTVALFLNTAGHACERVVALEPDRRSFKKLQARVRSLGAPNIQCLNMAAWDRPGMLAFGQTAGRQNAIVTGKTPDIHADSIDNILNGAKAALIKYDVEGLEEEALRGSEKTIRMFRPALIISAYHRSRDLFALPMMALDFYEGYKLYLRRPDYIPAWDLHYILTP
ncbi:MAG: FkbM family methyltransferase [Oscillospiraceae bacterium]|nr:FkbM family methyltransferase [Oscillospiraceae bacterium]